MLGVPLVAPLALLVFVGSFIPIVGALAFGGLAVLVALVTGGVVKALVLLGILVIENQIEGHLLQPFVVGRYVRLHPLAIAVALAGGGLLAGIPGAIIAVPFVAVVNAVVGVLRSPPEPEPEPEPVEPVPEPAEISEPVAPA